MENVSVATLFVRVVVVPGMSTPFSRHLKFSGGVPLAVAEKVAELLEETLTGTGWVMMFNAALAGPPSPNITSSTSQRVQENRLQKTTKKKWARIIDDGVS